MAEPNLLPIIDFGQPLASDWPKQLFDQ